jgi:tetratricopeptide (TPR) repeat protein
MEEEFYSGKNNENLADTFYYLAGRYSDLGHHEKALQAYQELLGKRKINNKK